MPERSPQGVELKPSDAPAKGVRAQRPYSPSEARLHPVIRLQRTVGNQASFRLLGPAAIQPKLNAFGTEPDRAADESMYSASEGEPVPHPGQIRRPLTDATGMGRLRAKLEHALSADFSNVRVRTGSERAGRLGAIAFTQGSEIHVAPGQWSPETLKGQKLLGHELGHVLQQRSGRVMPTVELAGEKLNADPALEQEADALGKRVAQEGGHLQSDSALLSACASTPATASATLQCIPDPRAQEAERAATEMWGLLNDIDELGAEVEFVYYTSSGAMTLVSYKRTKPGAGSATTTISLDRFKRDTLGFTGGLAAGSNLVTFVGTTDRYFSMTFSREARKWVVEAWREVKSTGLPSTPPEGRSQPNVASPGWSPDVYDRVQKAVAKWIPVFQTYPQGTSVLNFSVTFDDDRLTKLDFLGQTNTGGKGPAFAPAAASTETVLINTILAFTQGLGKRTIKFTLEGKAPAGKTIWRVSEASTDRGPPPALPDEAAVIVADYRRMHAEIIQKWREGVQDAAIYAGMLGAEQLAFWLLGGVVAKGFGLAFEAVAPRLIGFIRVGSKGGGRAGVEYLETMVARLPVAERAEMQVLAKKAETEGIEALGKTERASLERLLKKLESLIDAPLAQVEKDTLRGRMGTRFGAAKPGVDALFQSAQRSYQIHHRLPLEWAHKFPGIDPNAGANLLGIETTVHRGVNAVWTRLRTTAPTSKVSGNAVSRVMDIVDRHFKKWFDNVPSSSGSALEAEVQAAKASAYAEVDAIVKAL
jgi:Domain of unknown function (DUF4157)